MTPEKIQAYLDEVVEVSRKHGMILMDEPWELDYGSEMVVEPFVDQILKYDPKDGTIVY